MPGRHRPGRRTSTALMTLRRRATTLRLLRGLDRPLAARPAPGPVGADPRPARPSATSSPGRAARDPLAHGPRRGCRPRPVPPGLLNRGDGARRSTSSGTARRRAQREASCRRSRRSSTRSTASATGTASTARRLRAVPVRLPFGAEDGAARRRVERLSRSGHAVVPRRAQAVRPGRPRPAVLPVAGLDAGAGHPGRPGARPACSTARRAGRRAGGRIYLAKDTRLRPELLAAMYPGSTSGGRVRRRVDPDGVFTCDLARRLAPCDSTPADRAPVALAAARSVAPRRHRRSRPPGVTCGSGRCAWSSPRATPRARAPSPTNSRRPAPRSRSSTSTPRTRRRQRRMVDRGGRRR